MNDISGVTSGLKLKLGDCRELITNVEAVCPGCSCYPVSVA